MIRAISTTSGSFRPLWEIDVVPMRTPLVTNGFSGSNGIMFLFTVIPTYSSAFSNCFPVSFFGRRSARTMWLSEPPLTIRKP